MIIFMQKFFDDFQTQLIDVKVSHVDMSVKSLHLFWKYKF